MTTETITAPAKPAIKEILVFKEKHGDEYYDASTKELFYKTLLAVLRSRMNSGYYYYEPKEPDISRYEEYVSIPKEIAQTLPAGIQKEIAKAESTVKELKSDYAKEKAWYDCAVHVLNLPEDEAISYVHVEDYYSERTKEVHKSNHNALLWLFRERQDHQYEGWDIIRLNSLDRM